MVLLSLFFVFLTGCKGPSNTGELVGVRLDKLKANKVNAIYIKDFNEIVKYVKSIMEPNDIILTLGAGDVTKISEMF